MQCTFRIVKSSHEVVHFIESTAKHYDYLKLIVDLNLPITVYFGAFPSNRIRLQEAGINYRAVESTSQLGCKQPHDIFGFEGWFCVYGER